MDAAVVFRCLADAVLVLHFAVVAFVVGGLVLVLAGHWRGWAWVDGWAFRLAHLGAIGYVVLQQWLGAACPLTTLEIGLRRQAGQAAFAQGFIEHWLQRLLFYEAPGWVFTLGYTLFGLAVLAAWYAFPPGRRKPAAINGPS